MVLKWWQRQRRGFGFGGFVGEVRVAGDWFGRMCDKPKCVSRCIWQWYEMWELGTIYLKCVLCGGVSDVLVFICYSVQNLWFEMKYDTETSRKSRASHPNGTIGKVLFLRLLTDKFYAVHRRIFGRWSKWRHYQNTNVVCQSNTNICNFGIVKAFGYSWNKENLNKTHEIPLSVSLNSSQIKSKWFSIKNQYIAFLFCHSCSSSPLQPVPLDRIVIRVRLLLELGLRFFHVCFSNSLLGGPAPVHDAPVHSNAFAVGAITRFPSRPSQGPE